MKLLLFLILLIVCWPAALVALILFPFIWLILLPFRLLGIVVGGVFELIGAIFTLPARLIRAISPRPRTSRATLSARCPITMTS